jgi:hypothetical protein
VTGETAEPAGGQRVSFPIGVPFVVYPLLLWGIVEGSAHWWGWIFQVVYIGLLALFSREALSRAEYQKAHAKDPSLSRMTWVINWLLFFVVLPAVVWAVTMVLLLGELPSRSP